MYDLLNKKDLRLYKMNSDPKNPSNFLTSKVRKMAYGTLTNVNKEILYNGNPIDGIQGAVIVDGDIFTLSDDIKDKWELEFDDLGEYLFTFHEGKECYRFSSDDEKNMQVFLNFGFGGREVLLVLDTRICKQGCVVNKGPKFAEQMETLFGIIIQYYIAAGQVNDGEDNYTSLPPHSELCETQEAAHIEGDFDYEGF